MKRIGAFFKEFFSADKSFEERIIKYLSVTGDIAMLIALIFDVIGDENIVEIVMLAVLTLLAPVVTFISVRTGKIVWGIRIQVIAIVFIVLPVTFFFGGGIYGGGIFWIAFAYLFAGVALSGVWSIVMLCCITVIAVIEYLFAYYYHGSLYPHNYRMFVMDALVSIILTGLLIYSLQLFQKSIYDKENKKAKEEAARAEELNRSQSRFFSSMSHEIRTPINSVLGLNELILREEGISEEVRRNSRNIQGAGRMLLSLVNDILDVSKIHAGKMDIIPVNYKVGELLSETVNMVWLKAEEKGLKLEVTVDPSIPAELFGDEVRIRQILINLLNNAVKYTKEGTVTLHLECRDKGEDSVLLLIDVTDTGMGIRSETIPYLFDSFQRADEEKNRNIEGTGLGLSIVKQLVDLMGGKISVYSVYTQGSTFSVELRQGISNRNAIGEMNITNYGSVSEEKKYVCGFKATGVRILIVDDNEMNLTVEKGLLADTGMIIDTVLSGEEALALSLVHRYDVILMDHLMPEMDGIECLKSIRRQVGGLNNQVPVIVLTANAGSENRELYRNSGFDDYLVKPVSGKQMEEMLLKYLPISKVTQIRSDLESREMNTAKGYIRKTPVIITASSICDLPEYVVERLPISIIPFSVFTDSGRFKDNVDVVSDELIRYINDGVGKLKSDTPTVEEFEQFFSSEVAKAHQVIHITPTTGMSKEYERASEAAREFGNVTVVNSENMSSADGLIVMLAGVMAAQNEPVERILSEIDYLKKRVHCSFILGGLDYMRQSGYISDVLYRIMGSLNIRLSLKVVNDKFGVDRLWAGTTRKNYERYIHHALPRTADPDLNVIFVTYAGLFEDDLLWIEKEIKKIAAFKYIIFQKASAAVSLNCGPGTFGLLYMDKGRKAWHLTSVLQEKDRYDEETEADGDTLSSLSQEALKSLEEDAAYDMEDKAEKKAEQESIEEAPWYESIEGIDGREAIKNSGSEDAFNTVLKIFYDSIDDRSREIQSFFETENWNDYTIRVHALKSSAKLIGALSLSEAAKELEMAGKSGDEAYIKEHHQGLMEQYLNYKDRLKGLYSDEAEITEDKPEADQFLMESVYQAIEEAAKDMDIDMIEEAFGELKDYTIPESEAKKTEAIREAAGRYDYDAILEILGSDK